MAKETFIKLPRIDYACSKDYLRPIMGCVLVTKKEVVASEGYILVIHQTEDLFSDEFIENMPDRFLVRSFIWALLCKPARTIEYNNEHNKIEIHDKHNRQFSVGVDFEKKESSSFPDYQKILDSFEPKKIDKIGISPEKLNLLKKAMEPENDVIEFSFSGVDKMILARAINSIGLIMPRIITF